MELYLPISYLNDFIFCPLSIYFHQLYGKLSTRLYYDVPQIEGKTAHAAIDEKRYSTHKGILQGMDVYSDQWKLCGKIDIFDQKKGMLTERKKMIDLIYDGYLFQLYAQYYCLTEMGYSVSILRFYSSNDNRIHPVKLPEEDVFMKEKFLATLYAIRHFSLEEFVPENSKKCEHCIYENFCDRSLKC